MVIRELENWRYLLEDIKFKLEVWMDYNNLEYFMKKQNLNKRQANWVLYLPRFNFILKHLPETKMEKVDGLSRRLDWKVGVEKYNKNQTLTQKQWNCSLAEVIIEGPEVEKLRERMKRWLG